MASPQSTLNLPEITAALTTTPFARHLHAFASTPSTNTLALAAAQAGVPTGVWVADEQTAGRGRAGHTWHSAPGDGLYVSILLRPALSGPDVLKISLAAGVAAVQAIHSVTQASITLRWPNDLMDTRTDKKLGGILTESALAGDGRLSYAVVGIGINLNQQTMPTALEPIATSLRLCLAAHCLSGNEIRREALLPVLLKQIVTQVTLLEREAAGERIDPGILARFERASPMVRGLHVQVAEQGGYTGLTQGLDANGLLRILSADGASHVVRHGGVRKA